MTTLPGLGTLMSVAWDLNRIQPINAYCPPGIRALADVARRYFKLSSEILARHAERAQINSV
jgi:hypothetical protein